MAIKLGSTIINKKLLGVNSLNKIMLGVIEIFPNIGGVVPPAWDPSDLFAANDDGLYYNFSLPQTLFQNLVGLPVTTVEQPIGVVADGSRKFATSSELVANNDFDNGWTVFSGTIVGTELVVNATGNAPIAQQNLLEPWVLNDLYEFTIVISEYTSGAVYASDVANLLTLPVGALGVGTHKLYYVCQRADGLTVRLIALDGFVGTIASFSAKRIFGNIATQTTAAARPLADSRYNLQVSTEDFSTADYRRNGLTATPQSGLAPDGTNTSNIIQLLGSQVSASFDGYAADHGRNRDSMQRNSIYFKPGTLTNLRIQYADNNGGNPGSQYTVATGVITNTGVSIGTIEDVGDGWLRFSASGVKTNEFVWWNIIPDFGLNTSASFEVWGYQVENVNAAATPASPYQWVNTATDYNWQIAPLRAKLDGVDDTLTNTSVVTLSDNALLYGCYGISITAGAAFGMIVESGASGEDGGFYVGCTSSVLEVRFNGAGGAFYYDEFSLAGFSGPLVIGVQLDRDKVTAQTAISLTINGQPQIRTTNTTTIANGTVFKPLPMFIGSRGGSSLRFKGSMQNITMIDKEPTASERTQMESWSMTQMGITP